MKKLREDIKSGNVWEGIKSFIQRRHFGLWGYLILTAAVALSFYLYDQDRQQRRKDITTAISISCGRLNLISDQNAADIYQNYADLKRNAKLLGVNLTPELKHQVLVDANHSLKNLRYYDCSVPPDQPQRFTNYKLISLGKPIPTVPNRGT